jgi:hypothetical protein
MPRGSSLQFGKGTVGRVAPARLSAKKLSGRNCSLATIRLTQSCAIVVINRIPELTPLRLYNGLPRRIRASPRDGT